MCYGALRWARIDKIYFGNTRSDAHKIGFSDRDIYEEINEVNNKSRFDYMERIKVNLVNCNACLESLSRDWTPN